MSKLLMNYFTSYELLERSFDCVTLSAGHSNPLWGVKIFFENCQIWLCCSSMYVLSMKSNAKVTNELFHELRIFKKS